MSCENVGRDARVPAHVLLLRLPAQVGALALLGDKGGDSGDLPVLRGPDAYQRFTAELAEVRRESIELAAELRGLTAGAERIDEARRTQTSELRECTQQSASTLAAQVMVLAAGPTLPPVRFTTPTWLDLKRLVALT